MTERSREIRLLREIAERLRAIATTHPTKMSDKLIELAAEFEAQAGALERRPR